MPFKKFLDLHYQDMGLDLSDPAVIQKEIQKAQTLGLHQLKSYLEEKLWN